MKIDEFILLMVQSRNGTEHRHKPFFSILIFAYLLCKSNSCSHSSLFLISALLSTVENPHDFPLDLFPLQILWKNDHKNWNLYICDQNIKFIFCLLFVGFEIGRNFNFTLTLLHLYNNYGRQICGFTAVNNWYANLQYLM